MTSWLIGQSIVNGLLMGGVYALISTGVTIIFGVMKMVNFAMGDLITVGMYMAWLSSTLIGGSAYMQIPFVIISMAAISLLIFILLIVPILNKGSTTYILMTVGLSFVVQNLLLIIFGANYKTIPSSLNEQAIRFGSLSIQIPRLIAFVLAFIIIIIVSILMSKTSLGRAMRATSEKVDVSEMLGVNTTRTFAIAFVVGIVLAGLAGLLVTPIYDIKPTAGVIFKATALMIVVIGGMGSIRGALLSSVLVGIVESLIATFVSADLGPAAVFLFFILVVYFKPQGLFGKAERIA